MLYAFTVNGEMVITLYHTTIKLIEAKRGLLSSAVAAHLQCLVWGVTRCNALVPDLRGDPFCKYIVTHL